MIFKGRKASTCFAVNELQFQRKFVVNCVQHKLSERSHHFKNTLSHFPASTQHALPEYEIFRAKL